MTKLPLSPIDLYISGFPTDVQDKLNKIKEIIEKLAPEAKPSICYAMPAYKTFNRPLVYFAAFSHHIGLYATQTGHEAFKEELSSYKQGKGSVQFPLDQPLPYDLITKIVAYRVNENIERYSKTKK
jgi:uncharacterized protein YdhG (YjbR/CyaY superfamily)